MGGSLSAVLANIVMDDVQLKALGAIQIIVLAYKRFMDDIFLIVREEEVDEVVTF